MTKTLSKPDEQKLMQAIEKTGEHVGDGDHPNDAIVKAAKHFSIRPGHINLMVNAYNTGQSKSARENGSGALEKAATFDMADASVILEQLYPTTVKTAAQIERDTSVSIEYSISPTHWQKRQEKAARLKTTLPPMLDRYTGDPVEINTDPLPTERHVPMKRAFHAVQDKKRADEEQRRIKTASGDNMQRLFWDMRDYLRSPGSPTLTDVTKTAELLFGANGTAIMNLLAKADKNLAKMAATRQTLDGDHPVFAKIAKLIEATHQYQRQMVIYAEHTKAAEAFETETLRPFVQGPSRSVLGDLSSGQVKQGFGGAGAGYLLGQVAKRMREPGQHPGVQQFLMSATDPAHEEQLRQISAQATLNRLMSEDEIISGYEPDDVLDAYNDIIATAPRSATNQLLLQSILRKKLTQGALDPMDVDQLLGMEEGLRKRDEGITKQPESAIPQTAHIMPQPAFAEAPGVSRFQEKATKRLGGLQKQLITDPAQKLKSKVTSVLSSGTA